MSAGHFSATGNRCHYPEVTDMVFGVLRQHSPTVETASIDEAYFDLTGACLPADGDSSPLQGCASGQSDEAEILATTALILLG